MAEDSARADEPSVEQLRERVGNPVWRLISTYCRPHLHYFGVSALTMLIARGFWLFPPVILGVAFDALFTGAQPYRLPLVPAKWIPEATMRQFWFSLGLFAFAFFGGSAVYIAGSWVRNIAAYRIQHDLRTDAYRAMQDLDFGFFENQQTGELMSILNNDVNQLEGFLTGTLQQAANAAFIVLVVGVYMVFLNWQLHSRSYSTTPTTRTSPSRSTWRSRPRW